MAQNPKDGKLLYHLTAIKNLESIFRNGILPREDLKQNSFVDVADHDILSHREAFNLHSYIPFHFIHSSPFAGAVQLANPDEKFSYITITRKLAIENKFEIIPRHPLSYQDKPLKYTDGYESINWDLFSTRDYSNHDCKECCMAECITKLIVPHDCFFSVIVKNEEEKQLVRDIYNKVYDDPPNFFIFVNAYMFIK